MKLIRKVSIGQDYKSNSMHYATGQEVYGGHKITSITESEGEIEIHIEKDKEVKPWKKFNKNMAFAIEYNLEY